MDYELRIKKAILEVKQGTSIRLAAEQQSLSYNSAEMNQEAKL